MSIFRKILVVLACLLAAGFSAWLRYGNVEATKQWLLNLRLPHFEASAPAPASREDDLPVHFSYGGTDATPRDAVMVLHFRRPDTPDETVAQVAVRVFDADGALRKEISVWGAFRHEASLGASVARFAIGSFPPGTYRVAADIGSRQPLGIKRAAIEFSSSEAEPLWGDLVKAK